MNIARELNEVVTPDPQALAVLPPQERAAVAIDASAAEKHLRELVLKSAEITNVVDANGRHEAHRAAMALKNARVAVVNVGKAAREDATAFQRAVVAEVERLAEITAGEEERLFGLRDAFDNKVRAEKEERERLAAIRAAEVAMSMTAIRELPMTLTGASAIAISDAMRALAEKEPDEAEFGDKLPDALALIEATGAQLHSMLGAAAARELAEVQRQQELERLRAEAAENKRKADEAEAQRLREERERKAELERSTRAQAEAMAAQKLHEEQMARIMEVQRLGTANGDARVLDTALGFARRFDPSAFGAMEPMANMAKNLAVANLAQSLARAIEAELPAAIEEAYALDFMIDEAAAQAAQSKLVPIHEIDWDEPAPLAPPKHFSLAVDLMVASRRAPQPPDDSPAVNAFRAAAAELRKTRSNEAIIALLEDELSVMAARR